MKKLSPRHKRLLLHRGRVALRMRRATELRITPSAFRPVRVKPYQVSIWDGGVPYAGSCNHAPQLSPSTLCLYENALPTLNYLRKIKQSLGRQNGRLQWVETRKRGLPRIKSYYDFSTIEKLSTAAALIITSDYDRAKRRCGSVPPAINLERWGDDAFKVLYEIGFFELIGHVQGNDPSTRYRDIEGGRYRLMKIMSGRNANELGNVASGIAGLVDHLANAQTAYRDLAVEINGAVGEAMINVARHAYPPAFLQKHPHESFGRWWITAKADRDSNTLTIVIYDQGATIPGTLPHREWYHELIEDIKRTLALTSTRSQMDHEFIAYSMKRGKTQTLEPGRGEGLPQMQELIDICGAGCLRIYSRSGAYIYEKDAGVTKMALPLALEGTLVEWELRLPGTP